MSARKLLKGQSLSEALSKPGPLSSRVRLVSALLESDDPQEREKAIDSIKTNQDALKLAAVMSKQKGTCLAAISKLSSCKSLAFVVENSADNFVIDAANDKINFLIEVLHPDSLMDLAIDAPYSFLRTAAVLQLHERREDAQLAYVGFSSEYPDTRELAMGFVQARRLG